MDLVFVCVCLRISACVFVDEWVGMYGGNICGGGFEVDLVFVCVSVCISACVFVDEWVGMYGILGKTFLVFMSLHGLQNVVSVEAAVAAATAAFEIGALLGREEEFVFAVTACGKSVG